MTDISAAGPLTQAPPFLGQRLRAVLLEVPQNGISARQLERKLGADAIWLSLLLLGAAALVPTPGVPFGIVCGCAIVLVAVHLLSGARKLPAVVARRRVPHRILATLISYLAPWIDRAEGYLRSRLRTLSAPGTMPLWAMAILSQGILIALPIPLGNPLPGIAVAVLALGLMRRDGVALLAGLFCCVLAAAWTVGLIVLGAELTSRFFA
jgi:hypothetical protein